MYAHTPRRLCHDAPAGTAAASAGVAGAAAGAAGAAACAGGAAACAGGAADGAGAAVDGGGALAAARLFISSEPYRRGIDSQHLQRRKRRRGVPGLLDESVSDRDVA